MKLSLLFLPVLVACSSAVDRANQTGEDAVAMIEEAIGKLTEQSSAWQNTLTQLEQKLVDDGRSTLANEVSNLMQRGIATGGAELRCNLDFIGDRMKQGLQGIVAELKNQPVPDLVPQFCQVVPSQIDLSLEASRRSSIELYGYDLDVRNEHAVRVTVLNRQGQESDVASSKIAATTHYLLTLNLSTTNGVVLGSNDQQVIFWKGTERLSTVNVLAAPPPPPCGASGQGCCTSGPSSCSSGLTCQSGICRTPPCGAHNEAPCSSGACDGAMVAIENVCKNVQITQTRGESCDKDKSTSWPSTTGSVTITRGQTKSFYTFTGSDVTWHCASDNRHVTCTDNTNYLTVQRSNDGPHMDVTCKRAY